VDLKVLKVQYLYAALPGDHIPPGGVVRFWSVLKTRVS
jgi:hypothetical protein